MSLTVDLFWSFRSPCSYLALPRTWALARDFKVDVRLRAVNPLAVRDATFFQRTPPQFARCVKLDSRRVARNAGIAFGLPRPDAIVQDMPTLVVAGEPCFGQDRFDLLIWRLEQHGLERRPKRRTNAA